jgi:uncharacterized protein YdaU (DUF1376 family)
VKAKEIDVQCLPYMPLHIERLRKSKAWLRCKRRPELAFYILNLWMRAWHELPAGSIEDDDDVLADAAMCSPEAWAGVKEDVLQGWERRDGRLFHSTVTEIATEAEGKLRKNTARTVAAREALQQKRDGTVTETVTEDVIEVVTEIATEVATDENTVTESVTEIVTSPEGKGREEKGNKKERGGADAPADMAFVGKVIRLNLSDFNSWRKAYPAIGDLTAELAKADAFYSDNPAKNGKWFFQVSKWLDRANKDVLKAASPDDQTYPPEIYGNLR